MEKIEVNRPCKGQEIHVVKGIQEGDVIKLKCPQCSYEVWLELPSMEPIGVNLAFSEKDAKDGKLPVFHTSVLDFKKMESKYPCGKCGSRKNVLPDGKEYICLLCAKEKYGRSAEDITNRKEV